MQGLFYQAKYLLFRSRKGTLNSRLVEIVPIASLERLKISGPTAGILLAQEKKKWKEKWYKGITKWNMKQNILLLHQQTYSFLWSLSLNTTSGSLSDLPKHYISFTPFAFPFRNSVVAVDQWFSNFIVHWNHLKGLLKA